MSLKQREDAEHLAKKMDELKQKQKSDNQSSATNESKKESDD